MNLITWILRATLPVSTIVFLLGFYGVASAALPDTGQTSCFNGSVLVACDESNTGDASGMPRQDGGLGLDSAGASKIGGGAAGFDYSKFDAAGNVLDASASTWACTRDNLTGLTWEVKTADGGLRDVGHRYAWSNADSAVNGGDAGGTTETARCSDSLNGQGCSSGNYVAAVNALNLCGVSDWRMPTQRELLTLVHAGAINPTIDTGYFPNTADDAYWAANSYGRIPAMAWGVHFGYGAANADYKTRFYRLRLVRGVPF